MTTQTPITEEIKSLEKLEGDLLEANDILNMIIEVSGYNKWRLSESRNITEDDYTNAWGGFHPAKLAEYFSVEVNISQTKLHTFSRKFVCHDEVYSVNVQVMPGHVYVECDTGSVGYSSEQIIPNNKLRKYLKYQL